MTFYDQLMQFTTPERQSIANRAGLSLSYLLKHTYVSGRTPKFHFHNAVGMDASSKGVIPFWEHTEGTVNWGYALERLKHAKRRGVI